MATLKLLSGRGREFLRATDPAAAVAQHLAAAVADQEAHAPTREPGSPLRLLLVGYAGVGNVGADVRVAEMVRHLRHLIPGDQVLFDLLTIGDRGLTAALPGVRPIPVEGYFVDVLAAAVAAADGTVVCEGSVFKSNFSDVLALLLTGGLALSSAAGRLSVAWAAEAGAMDELLRDFVAAHCQESLVITRNRSSSQVLEALPLRTSLGADPAWTYRPAPPARGSEVLRAAGWAGGPLVCVCPINPWWYPVEVDVRRAMALARSGESSDEHFGSVFFHHRSAEATARYQSYIDHLAAAVASAAARAGAEVVVVAMDPGDRTACRDLAARLPGSPIVVVSGEHAAPEIVAVLRLAGLLVSSRYHALVLAMPALVPVVGVAADERIPNLLAELGRPDLSVNAGGTDLGERLDAALDAAGRDPGALRAAQAALVAAQIRRVGDAGTAFLAELRRHLPHHAPPPVDREQLLVPPLDPLLEALVACDP